MKSALCFTMSLLFLAGMLVLTRPSQVQSEPSAVLKDICSIDIATIFPFRSVVKWCRDTYLIKKPQETESRSALEQPFPCPTNAVSHRSGRLIAVLVILIHLVLTLATNLDNLLTSVLDDACSRPTLSVLAHMSISSVVSAVEQSI
jgi:hypothetical protein